MDTQHIEKLLQNEPSPPAVSRDHVRQWITNEKRRGSRRRMLVSAAMLLGFGLLLGGLLAMINGQVDQIRRTVDRQPSRTVKQLEEVTWELCHEPPAEYFVQQLTMRRGAGRISSMKSF